MKQDGVNMAKPLLPGKGWQRFCFCMSLYRILISTYRKQGMAREEVRKQLCSESGQEEEKIDELLEKFW